MKKLIMLMLLVCGAFAMQAQPGNNDKRKPPTIEERTARAKKELNLSDKQAGKWKEIHEKYDKEIKAALNAKDREKRKTITDKLDAELNAILNKDQKKKFIELKKKRFKGRRPKGR